MYDRRAEISMTDALATFFGVLGLALLVANVFVAGEDMGFFGMAAIAVSVVERMRAYVCTLSRQQAEYWVRQEAERRCLTLVPPSRN